MSNKRNIIETKLEAKELYHIMSWAFVMSLTGILWAVVAASIGEQYITGIVSFGFLLTGIYTLFQSAHYYKLMNTN